MAPREKLIIGARLKALRNSLGLTQAQMAAELGVSPSYITLIETNQRPASARLLIRLAEVFDLNVSELAPSMDLQLKSDFASALKDPAVARDVPRGEVEAVLQASPRIARAFVDLHERLQQKSRNEHGIDRDAVEALQEGARPVEEIRSWLYQLRNYIDTLDRDAEEMAEDMRGAGGDLMEVLRARLAQHRTRVRIMPADVLGQDLRFYDPHRGELLLSEWLSPASRQFQLAVLLARLERFALIQSIIDTAGFTDPETEKLARVTLTNYFAAALIMPYQRFLRAAETLRYDIEAIGHRFGTSFEQTAHRLSTLQREGARGIPFFFARVDRAGNISKRFSAGRFPFSRFGGSCPLWNIHGAFESPGQLRTQLIRMPDGARYFSVSRTVTRAGGTFSAPAPRFAIGLGCDVAYAPRLVYADAVDLDRVEPTDVGLNCYLCERRNCASRAHTPINRKFHINDRQRSVAIVDFDAEE